MTSTNLCSQDYRSDVNPTWCKECGDYAVLDSLTEAFSVLDIDIKNTIIVSGVGCASRLPFYLKTYGLHTIHGRALPAAIGIKCVDPDKHVIVVGGDGDGFSIGGNHFIHAARKNPNITYIVMDNEIYGLTKGQNSPTSHDNLVTKVSPYLHVEDRINPVLMALSFNTSFIARGHSGDRKLLTDLIIKGIEHKGFSFIHALSPCSQYNKATTQETINQRAGLLPSDIDRKNVIVGMEYAHSPEKSYMGIFYQVERPTLEERLSQIKEMSENKSDYNPFSIKELSKRFG